MPRDKVFLLSDVHLLGREEKQSRKREHILLSWLSSIEDSAKAIYFLGDLFHYWYEYKNVIPKGATKIFAKLISIREKGIALHFIEGNHDQWQRDYLVKEIGMTHHTHSIIQNIFDKTFYLGHGHLESANTTFSKMRNALLKNPLARWKFRWLHPDIGLPITRFFAGSGKAKPIAARKVERNLIAFAQEKLVKTPQIDYFVFGHSHLPKKHELQAGKYYINTGDWISHFSYLEVSPDKVDLLFFTPANH